MSEKRIFELILLNERATGSNAPSGPAIEEPIENPLGVLSALGYAESKWLGERILASAAQHRGLHTVSVRVGQLCGGVSGYWNQHEWFPSIVKSAKYTGCLPAAVGVSYISTPRLEVDCLRRHRRSLGFPATKLLFHSSRCGTLPTLSCTWFTLVQFPGTPS